MSNPVFRAWLEERQRELSAVLGEIPGYAVAEREAVLDELKEIRAMLAGTERKHEDTEPPF